MVTYTFFFSFFFLVTNVLFGFNHTMVAQRNKALSESRIDDLIHSLTLEEKIGQLFYVFFYGDTFNEETAQLFEKYKIGNVIYYAWANALTEINAVKKLSESVQKEAAKNVGLPAFIAIDQEGGLVERLSGEFTSFPTPMAMAALCDQKKVEEIGFAMGSEMRAAGINLNFAPVVDINSNPDNPIIHVRSFGDDGKSVISNARAYIHGLKRAHVLSTLKHFPGHGNTNQDSHEELPIINYTEKELFKCELEPFVALQEADAIMSAHILLPKIDNKHPATTSKAILKGILRDKIGYPGVIISDSLAMRGLSSHQNSVEEAIRCVGEKAIEAFLGGCDQLILGRLEWGRFDEMVAKKTNLLLIENTLQTFKDAVASGRIDTKRLDESLKRILTLKAKYARPRGEPSLDISKNRDLAQTVSENAVTRLLPEGWRIQPLKLDNAIIFIPRSLILSFQSIAENYSEKAICYYDEGTILEDLSKYDNILFLSYNMRSFPYQKRLLNELSAHFGRKLSIVSLGNPFEILMYQDKHTLYFTYSHKVLALKGLFKVLENSLVPRGHLPVKRRHEGSSRAPAIH